jgi:hypothetical protein
MKRAAAPQSREGQDKGRLSRVGLIGAHAAEV